MPPSIHYYGLATARPTSIRPQPRLRWTHDRHRPVFTRWVG